MSATCPTAPATVKPGTPVRREGLWIETIDSLDDVPVHLAAWEDLLTDLVEPNPFYEPWQLLPALETFAGSDDWKLVFVYRAHKRTDRPDELCGVFPIISAKFGRWPIHVWRLWNHPYCYCCVPPLRNHAGVETLIRFGEWLSESSNGPLLWDVRHVCKDGGFGSAFIEASRKGEWLTYTLDSYARAMLRPAADSETYCQTTITTHHRQEIRRQRRRLGELGELETRCSKPGEDLSSWCEQFLVLENAGWKAREGTALASDATHRRYFERIVTEGADRDRVSFLGLFQDDRPIALKCNFLSPPGSFAFKIAFDESLNKFSPGVQLEIENINWMHSQPQLEWMDSCAARDHFMISRLWGDQRVVKRLLVSPGCRRTDLLLGLIQFSRAVSSAVRRRR